MKRRRENKWLLLFGILLILFSIFIISFDIYKNTKKEIQQVELVEDFFQEEPDVLEEPIEEEEVSTQENKVETSSPTYNYVAILEIPSIGLKRGIVDFNSKYNNVKYNIQIIEHSEFPIVENSNLILAGHNGSSNVSFFKNLYKDGVTTTSIRIHIKWTDDETATMDNKADTQTTIDETCKGNINVTLNFIQLQN